MEEERKEKKTKKKGNPIKDCLTFYFTPHSPKGEESFIFDALELRSSGHSSLFTKIK